MKRNKLTGRCFLLASLAALLLTGCGTQVAQTLDRTLFRPTAWRTNTVPERVQQIRTNQLVVVSTTNALGEVTSSTNREAVVLNVTIPAHQEVTPIAWAPNESTTGAINLVGGFTGPYGAMASTGITAVLGILAHLRGRKYRAAAVSLAQGIQHAAELIPDSRDKLISVQKQVQDDHGTRGVVDALINKFVEVKPALETKPAV